MTPVVEVLPRDNAHWSLMIVTPVVFLSLGAAAILVKLLLRTVPKPPVRALLPKPVQPAELTIANTGTRVLCRKCGHANPAGGETCETCGHGLFVKCHCGARNARSNERCEICGTRLRRRRIDRDDPIFGPAGGLVFDPTSSSSAPNDLGAALLMLAAVVMIFAVVLLYPELCRQEEQRQADRIEMHQREIEQGRRQ
jgi:ribosomal protein L40E